ncbi:metal-dependent hydrolase family protein [Thalassomonas sp. M1454]|uniref:amidohydrolase family protein n=1 Tax=Thalassomonas sp. M1454 TaxID=2594477 RepID=UPI0011813800|nr:amidohydrolase family protein [Thalassomonas sp. M1454]TRX53437.1 amidohydrolase family protein [Thalassomonas sp. M1454]
MKIKTIVTALALALASSQVLASTTLFKNVNVFDGSKDKLHKNCSVLIEKNTIKDVCTKTTTADVVIDGKGKTLMPGLIDSHVHFNLMNPGGVRELEAMSWEKIGAGAAYGATEWLANGFTTVRDMGGLYTGLREVIDSGMLDGPRIYNAGGFISQTSGHGDWRSTASSVMGLKHTDSNTERLGIARVVDGPAQVMAGVRQNFGAGADYTKVMIGGGVSSDKDPLHSLQFTEDEIKAAVEASEAWDTYVAAHVYQDEHIDRGIDLGIKVFDHAQFISEKTLKKLKSKGYFISPNTNGMNPDLLKHPVYGNPDLPQYPKVVEFMEKSKNLFKHLRKVKPKIVFNTDIVFTTGAALRSGIDFQKYDLARGIGNFEALKSMTSYGGELAALTGKNNPYPKKLGVIEKGAYADIIIVDGNPLEDITAIGAHDKWLDAEPRGKEIASIKLIMKDGKVYKNTL